MRHAGRVVVGLLALLFLAQAHAAPRIDIGRDLGLDKGWLPAYRAVKRQMDKAGPNAKFAYVSGPVSTGGAGTIGKNLQRGTAAANALRAQGYAVVSPFELEGALRSAGIAKPKYHATFMKIWSRVLADPRVDRLVLLPGAESSVGATIEQGLFAKDGRTIQRAEFGKRGKVTLRDVRVDPKVGRVEHTLLGTTTTKADVEREARWAGGAGVRAMVVRPEYVETAARSIGKRLSTVTAAVIGFPQDKFADLAHFAPVSTRAKLDDAKRAIRGAARAGAHVLELDMILDVHAVKAGNIGEAQRDVERVIAGARAYGKQRGVATKVKVILETSLLTPREVAIGAAIVRRTKALSVKTSTGYGPRGASVADLHTIQRIVGDTKLIKVSGGVTAQTYAQFERLGHIFGMSKTRELAGAAPVTGPTSTY